MSAPTLVCCSSKVHALASKLDGKEQIAKIILCLAMEFIPAPQKVSKNTIPSVSRGHCLVKLNETLGDKLTASCVMGCDGAAPLCAVEGTPMCQLCWGSHLVDITDQKAMRAWYRGCLRQQRSEQKQQDAIRRGNARSRLATEHDDFRQTSLDEFCKKPRR